MLTPNFEERLAQLEANQRAILEIAPQVAAGLEPQDDLMRAVFASADVMAAIRGAGSAGALAKSIFDLAKPLTIGRAVHTEWPAPEFILGPLQPGDIGMLSGGDGLGKSWCAGAAGMSVAYPERRLFGGMFDVPPGPGGKVLYIAVEDRERDHGSRIKKLVEHARLHDGLRVDEDDDRLTVLPLQGRRLPLFCKAGTSRGVTRYEPTDIGRRWADDIKDYRLVIIDPLRAFHDLDEADGTGMDSLARWLVTVAMANQQAILLVHHASQSAILDRREDHHAGRGTTELPASCRAVWTLRTATEKEVPDENDRRDRRVLVNGKATHGAESGRRHLVRGIGGVLYVMDPPVVAPRHTDGGASNQYQAAKDGRTAPTTTGASDEDWE